MGHQKISVVVNQSFKGPFGRDRMERQNLRDKREKIA